MDLGLIELGFTPSVSVNLVGTRINVTIGGAAQPEAVISPTQPSYQFEAPSLADVNITVTPFSALEDGVAATLHIPVPDLSRPLPVTDLSFKILSVRSVPDAPAETVSAGSGS